MTGAATRGLCVLLAISCMRPAASVPYPMHSSACKDDKSWAAALHARGSAEKVDMTLPDTVMVALGTEWDAEKGRCRFTDADGPPLRVQLTNDRLTEHQAEWTEDAVTEDPANVFLQAKVLHELDVQKLLPDHLANARMVWRWDPKAMVFTLIVKSMDPKSSVGADVKDVFKVSGRRCAAPLPLMLENLEGNPKYKCAAVGLYPDSCSRRMHIGTGGRDFQVKLGSTTTGQANDCKWATEVYTVSMTPDVMGTDEQDRSFFAIGPPAGETDKPMLPGSLWGYRTSMSGMAALDSTDGFSPTTAHVLQLAVDSTPELKAAFEAVDAEQPQPPGSSRSAEEELDLERDLSGITNTLTDDSSAGEPEADPRTLVFTLKDAATGKNKNCLAPLGDTRWGPGERSSAGDGWERLVSQPIQDKMRRCLQVSPAADLVGGVGADADTPCEFFSKLNPSKDKPMGASSDAANKVFVSLAVHDSDGAGSCESAVVKHHMSLSFKQDLVSPEGGVSSWKLADVGTAGEKVVGKGWSWRASEDGIIEVAFKISDGGALQAFRARDACPGSWEGGVVLVGQKADQHFSCLTMGLAPNACDHALGLAQTEDSFAAMEAELARAINPTTGLCDYTSGFAVAFTNEPWKSPLDSEGRALVKDHAWNQLYVDPAGASSPLTWRWRSKQDNTIAVAFEDNSIDPNKEPVTVELVAAEQCARGKFPNVQGAWQIKSLAAESSFKCMRLSNNRLYTSAFFKHAAVFERLLDLQECPSAGKGGEGDAPPAVARQGGEDPECKRPCAGALVARAVFLRNPRQLGPGRATDAKSYTGLLSKDKVPLLVRYSPSTMVQSAFVAGWAFKFFRDETLPSDDIIAYHSVKPQKECDLFNHQVFATIPVEGEKAPVGDKTHASESKPGEKMDCSQRFVADKFASKECVRRQKQSAGPTAKAADASGKKTGPQPTSPLPPGTLRTGVAHLFLSDQDAWSNRRRGEDCSCIAEEALARSVYPDGLVFSTEALQPMTDRARAAADLSASSKDCDNQYELANRQLGTLRRGDRLFDVYAMRSVERNGISNAKPWAARDLLGSIVVQDPFVSSWAGDQLPFEHEPYCDRPVSAKLAAEEPAASTTPAKEVKDMSLEEMQTYLRQKLLKLDDAKIDTMSADDILKQFETRATKEEYERFVKAVSTRGVTEEQSLKTLRDALRTHPTNTHGVSEKVIASIKQGQGEVKAREAIQKFAKGHTSSSRVEQASSYLTKKTSHKSLEEVTAVLQHLNKPAPAKVKKIIEQKKQKQTTNRLSQKRTKAPTKIGGRAKGKSRVNPYALLSNVRAKALIPKNTRQPQKVVHAKKAMQRI